MKIISLVCRSYVHIQFLISKSTLEWSAPWRSRLPWLSDDAPFIMQWCAPSSAVLKIPTSLTDAAPFIMQRSAPSSAVLKFPTALCVLSLNRVWRLERDLRWTCYILSYPGNYCFELQLDGNVVQMTDFAAQWAVSRPQRYLLPLNMLRTYSFSCLILVSVLVLIIKLRKRWKRKCRLLCIVVRIAFVISFLFEISLTSLHAGFCAFDT